MQQERAKELSESFQAPGSTLQNCDSCPTELLLKIFLCKQEGKTDPLSPGSLTLFQSGPPLLTSAACLRDMQMVITPGAASSPFPAHRGHLAESSKPRRDPTHTSTPHGRRGDVGATAVPRELDSTGGRRWVKR